LRLKEEHFDYLRGFDVVHCGCYADMADEIEKLDELTSVKTYDFSSEEEYRTDEYLNKVCPHVDIALFSQEEMTDDQALELQKKVHDLGTELVIVTNGSKGQKLWDGKRTYKGTVKMVDAVDTMGAGDSFFTAFVVQLLREGYRRGSIPPAESIQRAFEFAAHFSAQVCMEDGAFGFGTRY
jgi:sugar/nucleoside kinase (ribokinase family)